MKRYGNRSGFTVVELLIVIIVVAILAVIVSVAYNGIQNQARQAAAATELRQVEQKVETYAARNRGLLPVQLEDAGVTASAHGYEYR